MSDARRQPALADADLVRLAEAQGAAWARAGLNARKKILAHSAHWPGDRQQRVHLVRAARRGALQGKGGTC